MKMLSGATSFHNAAAAVRGEISPCPFKLVGSSQAIALVPPAMLPFYGRAAGPKIAEQDGGPRQGRESIALAWRRPPPSCPAGDRAPGTTASAIRWSALAARRG